MVDQPIPPFRVGTLPRAAQIAALTPEQMSTRAILDPRYSDSDPHFANERFAWQNYIRIDVADHELRASLELTLNQFSQTPEGRNALRQGAAMQTYRWEQGRALMGGDVISDKVTIVAGTKGTTFLDDLGTIVIDPNELRSQEYINTRGGFSEWSLQHAVYHEMLHAADALMIGADSTQEMLRPLQERLNSIVDQNLDERTTTALVTMASDQMYAPIFENPAMIGTNSFTAPYYREEARALNHSAHHHDDTPESLREHVHQNINLPRAQPDTERAR